MSNFINNESDLLSLYKSETGKKGLNVQGRKTEQYVQWLQNKLIDKINGR